MFGVLVSSSIEGDDDGDGDSDDDGVERNLQLKDRFSKKRVSLNYKSQNEGLISVDRSN